jgi:hypothetical protein
MPVEGIEEHGLYREGMAMLAIELSATLRISHVNPVGCPIARPVKATPIYKRFQENGLIAVAYTPISRKALGDGSQNSRRKVPRRHPRQDQEASIVHDQMKALGTLFGSPTYESVARRNLPRGGAETQSGEKARATEDKVPQLRARQGLIPQVVIAFDEFIPQR